MTTAATKESKPIATRIDSRQSRAEGQKPPYLIPDLAPPEALVTLQRKVQDTQQAPIQKQSSSGEKNSNGLPNALKEGVEHLSGLSMDDVKVHYNSDKPAQMKSLAYTQGPDIYVGPGQEQHVPHEAWHAAQQKQGRVQATMQMKNGAINADPGLEKEADIMGARALAFGNGFEERTTQLVSSSFSAQPKVMQCKTVGFEFQSSNTYIYHKVTREQDDHDWEETETDDPHKDFVDPSRATGLKSSDHPGSIWVEHRRPGKTGSGVKGSRRSDEWFDMIKPVIEASSGHAEEGRDWETEPSSPGTTAPTDAVYEIDDSNRLADVCPKFKVEGDGSELELITFPVNDDRDSVVELFKAVEAYIEGLALAETKTYKVVNPKNKKRTVDKRLRMTEVSNGFIGIVASKDDNARVEARPQATFSLDISRFPQILKSFTELGRWREAHAGSKTRAPLARLAEVSREGLGEDFADMSDDVFGFLMFIAHIVVTARHSAPGSLGKDLAALAPRTKLHTELKWQAPQEEEEDDDADHAEQAPRELAFTDENMLAILQKADPTIELEDKLAFTHHKARVAPKRQLPDTTIKEYFELLRNEALGAKQPRGGRRALEQAERDRQVRAQNARALFARLFGAGG